MVSHHRHARRARRRWCAGLAAIAVVAASLASAGTAFAAARRHPAASSADCTGTASAKPLVPFNTIAYDGDTAGVQVGSMFCPDPDDQAVQVVVLDSGDLSLVSNRGYSTSQFGDHLGSDLRDLPSSDLVFVTHPGNQSALPADALAPLDTSLGAIGGNLGAQWQFGQNTTAAGCSSLRTSYCETSGATWQRVALSGSSFTVIGIPKMSPGQAWRETAAQNGTPDGRITGYLQLGTVLTGGQNGGPTRYTVVNGPDPYVPVDTCIDPADPDNLNDPWCAVKVGDQTYPATSGVNGLHVVELDRTTLRLITNRTVTTTADLNSMFASPPSWQPTPPVARVINSPSFLNDQRVVIIQSVGDGKLSGSLGSLASVTQNGIDQLGGTIDYLADAITHGCRYALVGAATDLPWHATTPAESSTAMAQPADSCDQAKDNEPTGHVSGVLQRDREGLYRPAASDAVAPTNVDLYQILYQPATAWPYASDTTNLRYIADNIGLCDPAAATCKNSDVRAAYPETGYKSSWPNFRSDLKDLTCPPTFPQAGTCDPGNFGNVKDELLDEFKWIPFVYDLTDDLRAPYAQGSGTTVFDVKKITDDIVDDLKTPPDQDATMQWLKVFTGVMTIASKAVAAFSPAASAVFGVLGAASTVAADLMQKGGETGGGPADSVTTAADNLGSELGYQQTAYLEWVNNAQDILLSDYGRLKAVAALVNSPSWSWPSAVTNALIQALQAGTRASAYSALLPVVWGGFNLKAGSGNPPDPDNVANFNCAEAQYTVNGIVPIQSAPFAHALPANQFHSVNGFDGNGTPVREVWTFARNVSGFADNQVPAATVPGESAAEQWTKKIYGADSTDPTEGAFQYEASWWRSTFNPPSHVTCNQIPIPNIETFPRPFSSAWPPPKIDLP